MSGSLNGLHLLVTRPEHQAAPLCHLIKGLGGDAICFPTLVIEAIDHPAFTLPSHIDIVIFVSANAVKFGLTHLANLPATTRYAAVGKSTAQTLMNHGINPDIVPPQQFDSDGLLALAQLQDVAGKQVVIVRGETGRDYLGDQLHQRGATVSYLPCYRRRLPQIKVDNVLHKALQNHQLDIILIHSGEALQNLLTLCDEKDKPGLLATQLTVIHHRQAELAQQLGFEKPAIISPQADDESLVKAVIDWQSNQT